MRITEDQLRRVIRQVIKESMLNEMLDPHGHSYDFGELESASGHAQSMKNIVQNMKKELLQRLDLNGDESLVAQVLNVIELKGKSLKRSGQDAHPLEKIGASLLLSVGPGYQFIINNQHMFTDPSDPRQLFPYLTVATAVLLLLEAFLYGTSHSKANIIRNKLRPRDRMNLSDIVYNQEEAKKAGYSEQDIDTLVELHKEISEMNDEHMLMKPKL